MEKIIEALKKGYTVKNGSIEYTFEYDDDLTTVVLKVTRLNIYYISVDEFINEIKNANVSIINNYMAA